VRVFRFIHAEKATFPVSFMCRMLGVSRSGYYAWCSRPPSRRAVVDAKLTTDIKRIHKASRETYGWPRVLAELQYEGTTCGGKRVFRLMAAAGIQGIPARRGRRRGLTRRRPGVAPHPDLVERNFVAPVPDLLWVADITEIRTGEGKLYLATILDCCSRRIVGWSMSEHMRAELVVDALEMATNARRPAPGLVHHSDQGSQYVALAFTRRLRQAGILGSMGGVGSAYDNAAAESLFSTIKRELVHRHRFPTRAAARTAVFEYIEVFYNRIRRHSSIGMLAPVQFERRLRQEQERASVA
jgi:putative transposase